MSLEMYFWIFIPYSHFTLWRTSKLEEIPKIFAHCMRTLHILWENLSRNILLKPNHLLRSMSNKVFVNYSHYWSAEENFKSVNCSNPCALHGSFKMSFFFHGREPGVLNFGVLIKSFRMIAKVFQVLSECTWCLQGFSFHRLLCPVISEMKCFSLSSQRYNTMCTENVWPCIAFLS